MKIIDETKCGLAKEEIKKNETYSLDMGCRRDEKKCEIEKFVMNNREAFSKILNGLQSNEEFEKVCNSLEEILEGYEKARGKKNCWRLGDCIISIEAPKNFKIFTTDHHYEMICESIDKDAILYKR